MKKTIIILLGVFALSLSLHASPQKQKVKYTLEEIYGIMCTECHRADGSGNTEKLTPSLRDSTQKELENAMLDIEDEKGHVVMEHNREKILEKGMEYGSKEMAEYMYNRFHKDKK